MRRYGVVACLALVLVIGCDPRARDSLEKSKLPEHPEWLKQGQDRARRKAEREVSEKESLAIEKQTLAEMGQKRGDTGPSRFVTLLACAQRWAAERALACVPETLEHGPIVLSSMFGKNCDNKPCLWIHAICVSREVTKALLVARGPDAKVAFIEYDLKPATKEEDLRTEVYLQTTWLPWNEFVGKCTPEGEHAYRLHLTKGEPWLLPIGEGVDLVVALEDSQGRVSGFIPSYRLDLFEYLKKSNQEEEDEAEPGRTRRAAL